MGDLERGIQASALGGKKEVGKLSTLNLLLRGGKVSRGSRIIGLLTWWSVDEKTLTNTCQGRKAFGAVLGKSVATLAAIVLVIALLVVGVLMVLEMFSWIGNAVGPALQTHAPKLIDPKTFEYEKYYSIEKDPGRVLPKMILGGLTLLTAGVLLVGTVVFGVRGFRGTVWFIRVILTLRARFLQSNFWLWLKGFLCHEVVWAAEGETAQKVQMRSSASVLWSGGQISEDSRLAHWLQAWGEDLKTLTDTCKMRAAVIWAGARSVLTPIGWALWGLIKIASVLIVLAGFFLVFAMVGAILGPTLNSWNPEMFPEEAFGYLYDIESPADMIKWVFPHGLVGGVALVITALILVVSGLTTWGLYRAAVRFVRWFTQTALWDKLLKRACRPVEIVN